MPPLCLSLLSGGSLVQENGVKLHKFTKYKREWLHDQIEYRYLNIASALLIIIGVWAIFEGVWALFLSARYLDAWMKMYGATIPHTDFMIHVNQFYGLEKLIGGLFFCVISLIPYRKAEKWAWYAILVIGGIHMLGMLILWTPHAPFSVIFVILWIVGLVLPYKQILGKSS